MVTTASRAVSWGWTTSACSIASSTLPTGGYLEQADGTAWMVFFSQNMLRIAVELAFHDPLYEEFVQKFFEHTIYIASATDRLGNNQDEMWDEQDGFYYNVLLPGGASQRLKGNGSRPARWRGLPFRNTCRSGRKPSDRRQRIRGSPAMRPRQIAGLWDHGGPRHRDRPAG